MQPKQCYVQCWLTEYNDDVVVIIMYCVITILFNSLNQLINTLLLESKL